MRTLATASLAAGLGARVDGAVRTKAPFKLLYSNDTTNITTCVSPYHPKGAEFRPEMLEASVSEVAGKVDAHFIQLAHGQVPWYPSKVLPLAEHHRWWAEHFKVAADDPAFRLGGIHQFILNGGDPLQVFVDACRKNGQAPFVSLRLNDVHHVEHVDVPGNIKGLHSITRFYAEHPEWRIGGDLGDWNQRSLNWAVPEVRNRMMQLIEEQCRNYDIEGFELDFMRHPSFFRVAETTPEERRAIMTTFIREVRKILDDTRRNSRRWLCVRIPCYVSGFDPLGIDLPAWIAGGVDMINLSPHYFTVQQTDLPEIRAMAPGAAIYQEMCHSTWNGRRLAEGYDAFSFRRTTAAQYQSTAHLAYAQGADGVSVFNFAYYREHGAGERGPFNEPPFDVLPSLRSAAALAKLPQQWFLAPGWKCPFGGIRVPMPIKPSNGKSVILPLRLSPLAGSAAARLRFQSSAAFGESVWRVWWNGIQLEPTDDVSDLLPDPYPPLHALPAQLRAWTVPVTALRQGSNEIQFQAESLPAGLSIEFIDLTVR